jgi:hypothetical protein
MSDRRPPELWHRRDPVLGLDGRPSSPVLLDLPDRHPDYPERGNHRKRGAEGLDQQARQRGRMATRRARRRHKRVRGLRRTY